jgi:hypothetical protein
MDKEVVNGILDAAGTVAAALIVGVAGGLIGRRYSRERDRQDKESQWRRHAIELTKLDLERKIHALQGSLPQPARQTVIDALLGRPGTPEEEHKPSPRLRPSILDFLANYRDLQELGQRSPAELYRKILEVRISEDPQEKGDSGIEPSKPDGSTDKENRRNQG